MTPWWLQPKHFCALCATGPDPKWVFMKLTKVHAKVPGPYQREVIEGPHSLFRCERCGYSEIYAEEDKKP